MIKSRRILCILFASIILILASCAPDHVVPNESITEDTAVDREKLYEELLKNSKGEDCENIDPALATEMKIAYARHINGMGTYNYKEFTAEDMWVQEYFGEIGKGHLVYMSGETYAYHAIIRYDTVAGYTLSFGEQRIYVYADGVFYTLQKAYGEDIISREDVYEIGKLINNNFTELYPNQAHELDCDNIEQRLATKIKTAYAELLNKEYHGLKEKYQPSELWVDEYFGEFGKCHFVYMGADGIGYTEAVRGIEVADYLITIRDGQLVYAYNDGKLYTIKEAYDNGLIEEYEVRKLGTKIDPSFADRYPDES